MEPESQNITENGWAIYIIAFLVLVAVYFIQKYAYLIDIRLSKAHNVEPAWKGKPWHLLTALFLGIFALLYDVFSPKDLEPYPANWGWMEWALLISCFILLSVLAAESFKHFGSRLGLLRLIILFVLSIGFYAAGLLAGLIIVALLALVTLVYFINFLRKKMT